MNILVTGGSGFIGTRLVNELLAAGHQVAIFDTAASKAHRGLCIVGDVRDAEALAAATRGRDAIVHLAAEHRDDALSTALCEEVNVDGAANVAAAAREEGCRRVVFTSSGAVYPLDEPLASEESAPRPHNEYGRSKLRAEQALSRWADTTAGASLAIVRACVVFGEGNRGNVYNLVRQIHRRRFVMVGSGRNRKSMAYVGNVTRFLGACLDFPPGVHLLNYADKPDLTTAELVELARRSLPPAPGFLLPRLPLWLGLAGGVGLDALAKLTGKPFAVSASRIRKFAAETTISTRRLEQSGFVAPYPLRESLERTIRAEFRGG
jgi:GlcNAc-P-P-Und epimerase